jgi:hypothetical protein
MDVCIRYLVKIHSSIKIYPFYKVSIPVNVLKSVSILIRVTAQDINPDLLKIATDSVSNIIIIP